MQNYQLIALAMLLGSIPFRTLVKLRRKRAGNDAPPRPLEPAYVLAGVMDMIKVCVPVYLAARGYQSGSISLVVVWAAAIIGVASDAYPYWLMFKPQGAGMAAAAGVAIGLGPLAGGAALVVWFLTLLISDKPSLAAIVAAVSVPVWLKVTGAPMAFVWIGLAGFAYVMMVHSSAIARLIDGSEPGWYRNNK